jgi:hypothetical protein
LTDKIWSCKIGPVDASKLPEGADLPMRIAISRAFYEVTGGEVEDFLFSGWAAELTESEQKVVDYMKEQRGLQ